MCNERTQNLEEIAGRIELYGRRKAVLQYLSACDFAGAARLCREAMHEAHERARYNCAPIGPEGHKRNFYAIAALRNEIERVRRVTNGGHLQDPGDHLLAAG